MNRPRRGGGERGVHEACGGLQVADDHVGVYDLRRRAVRAEVGGKLRRVGEQLPGVLFGGGGRNGEHGDGELASVPTLQRDSVRERECCDV